MGECLSVSFGIDRSVDFRGTAQREVILVVLGDDTVIAAATPPNAPFSYAPIALAELDRAKLVTHEIVVFDIDLRNIEHVRALRAALAEHVPGQARVFVIDKGSRAARVQAMVLGASRVLERPVTPLHLARAISEILAKRAAERSQHNALLMEEAGSSIALASCQLGAIFASQRGGGRLQVATVQSAAADIADDIANVGFRQWLDTVRRHHEGTFQHCLLVTGVATNFAQAMGMSRADVVTLTTAGMLHDIGKADIPLAILDKPGQLSASERVVMEAHPVVGQEHLLKSSDVPGEILAAVRHHHEMLDGSGYPDRLCGRQIDDITRILTICDIYGALTERRSYKAPMQPEGALNVLETMAQDGKVERALVGALRMAVMR